MAKVKEQLTAPILKQKLEEYGLKLRYDVITHKIDIKGGQAIGCNEHTTADTLVTLLQDKLRPDYTCTTDADIRARLKLVLENNKYNSFIEKINSYPEWNEGKPDRIEQLCTDGLCLPEDDWLSRSLIKKWLLQTLLIADNDEKKPFAPQGVLVLQGGQGIGKTHLVRVLSFFDNDLGDTGVQIDRNNKDTQIRATSHAIVEIGELGRSIGVANTDFIKAFLTQTTDRIRRPYDRETQELVRRTSYIGTVNADNGRFLTDTTGNRRFYTIPLTEMNWEVIDEIGANIGELWQQVKWEQLHNYKPDYKKGLLGCELTSTERKALAERNGAARISVKAEDELREYFEYVKTCGKAWDEYFVSANQLKRIMEAKMSYMPDIAKYDNSVIGRALAVLGYEEKRSKGVRGRLLPILTADISGKQREEYAANQEEEQESNIKQYK